MKRLLGILLLLLSNIIYIANNYIVKIVELSASEVAIVRGSIQVKRETIPDILSCLINH